MKIKIYIRRIIQLEVKDKSKMGKTERIKLLFVWKRWDVGVEQNYTYVQTIYD